MGLFNAIIICSAIPVISWGVTIVNAILQKKKLSTEVQYHKLYAEGEIVAIMDKSRALHRKDSPKRDETMQLLFDALTRGELVEGEIVTRGAHIDD